MFRQLIWEAACLTKVTEIPRMVAPSLFAASKSSSTTGTSFGFAWRGWDNLRDTLPRFAATVLRTARR